MAFAQTVLEIEGVSKRFKTKTKTVQALSDVSFSIRKGEIFGLLGPNGAGKTTLISVLCGLVDPDQGRVCILGKDIGKDMEEIKRRINFVPGFTNIGVELTVREFLRYYCLLYRLDDIDERIGRVTRLIDLSDRMDDLTLNLSSGYKQRLLFAKALLNEPGLLFLDEPTVGLDLEAALSVRELIKRLRDAGTTILLTTHNMYEAEELCDRIGLLLSGKLIMVGTLGQIKSKVKPQSTLEIEASDPRKLLALLKKQRFVASCTLRQRLVLASLRKESDRHRLYALLSRCGQDVYQVVRSEPTLEEAFLKLIRDTKGSMREEGNTIKEERMITKKNMAEKENTAGIMEERMKKKGDAHA